MAKSKLIDNSLYIMAGINPKTGLPTRTASDGGLKQNIRMAIRIMDEQDFVNRYKWINIPNNITSQELERMLYYKGQLAFFYFSELDEFYFMPYALEGTLDFYGRFNSIHPIPFTEGTEDEGKKGQASILSRKKLQCVYGVKDEEDVDEDTIKNSCVLLHDYTKQIGENIVPRYQVNEPIINMMSDCMPMMRTSLLIGSGIKGMRVDTADAKDEVKEANASLYNAVLNGSAWIPITGTTEFQDLANSSTTKAQEYMIAMQSLDNFRRELIGIDNGGLFEKKAHMNDSENEVNGSSNRLTYADGLKIRQHFCDVVNSIWHIGLWCEENVMPEETDVTYESQTSEGNEDDNQETNL